MKNDHNECPTCKQDWVADTDCECTACGRPASEHISVTSVCRLLYAAIAREDKLALEVEKLKAQLAEKETFIERVITWPHDADPFTSPDHDNDRHYP